MSGCLIIHGFTGGPYEVEPLADHLHQVTDWEIVSPRLPGHGLGENGKELELTKVTYQEWIQTCEQAYLDLKKRHEKIYLIGFSMGGMISAFFSWKVFLREACTFVDFKEVHKHPANGVRYHWLWTESFTKKAKNRPTIRSLYGKVWFCTN